MMTNPIVLFIGIHCKDVDKPEDGEICFGQFSDNGHLTKYIDSPASMEFVEKQLMTMIDLIGDIKEKFQV